MEILTIFDEPLKRLFRISQTELDNIATKLFIMVAIFAMWVSLFGILFAIVNYLVFGEWDILFFYASVFSGVLISLAYTGANWHA